MRINFEFRRFPVSGFRFPGSSSWVPAFCSLALLFSTTLAAEDELRVIAMAPHLTELAYAAGGGETLVGVVDWSDYPPEASELPSIGDAFRFDLERIMQLEPDLALAWRGGTPEGAVARIADLGIEIEWIESRSLDDIAVGLETLGEVLGSPEVGQRAAADFRDRLATFEPPESTRGRVFYQVSARPLYTLGGRHVINEVFNRCGLENIFAGLDTEAAVVDFEAVVSASPDLIIGSFENNDADPLQRWQASGLVDEKETRMHRVEPELLVRPTPRIIDGIEHICEIANTLQAP